MQFKDLKVIPAILKSLERESYEVPTPIQEEAIPVILSGKDLLGCAQTGTGKTAAFAIPTLQLLSEEKISRTPDHKIRALIITPTRELALQIYESFCTYGKYTDLKCCVVFGGVSQKPQEEMLRNKVDILVATPGRLLGLMDQKLVNIENIRMLILDEADRMLDMGFINDVKRIISKTPVKKQTLLFSATMPPDIASLASTILKSPAKIEITPVSSTVDTIKQYLYYVDKNNKKDLLLHILKDKSIESVLVFTRTKHGADRIVRQLAKEKVIAQAIHGDKSQGARQNALNNFKNKTLRILIATDIAARGIDIDELSHVINYDLPDIPETYVHRIGRTGRAGLGGTAISFCDFDEKELLVDIEGLIGKKLIEVKDHPYPLMNNQPAIKTTQPRKDATRRRNTVTELPQKNVLKSRTSSDRNELRTSVSTQKAEMKTGVSAQKRSYRTETTRQRNDYKTESSAKSYNNQAETSAYSTTSKSGTSTQKNEMRSGLSANRTKSSGSSTHKFGLKSGAATQETELKSTSSHWKSSLKTSASSKRTSLQTPSEQGVSTTKKKYRMTADGTLKEKKSYNYFSRKGKKK